MAGNGEKRRIPRIPFSCPVLVRQRLSSWSTHTEDIGIRGCRLALEQPLDPGNLVELQFHGVREHPALEAAGQVAWTCTRAPLAAGVAFLGPPRAGAAGEARRWVDDLVADQLRRALDAWNSAHAVLSRLGDVSLQLGTPPTEGLARTEIALVRLAREGVPLSSVCRSREGLGVVVGLMERGVVSVAGTPPDEVGWQHALTTIAGSATVRPN